MKRLQKAEAAKRKAERAKQLAAKRKACTSLQRPADEPAAREPSCKKPCLTSPVAFVAPSPSQRAGDAKPSPAPGLPAASPAATPAASPATDAKGDEKLEELENGEEEFVVEKVLRAGWAGRPHRSKRQYEVKWKGFPHSENTWEPASNLKDNAAFAAFLAAQ
jgi:hypothetical protein